MMIAALQCTCSWKKTSYKEAARDGSKSINSYKAMANEGAAGILPSFATSRSSTPRQDRDTRASFTASAS